MTEVEDGLTHTALVIPVPDASELCQLGRSGARRRVTAPVAHITIATPFVRESEIDASVIESVRSIARSAAPFEFVLATCGEFDNGWFFASPADAQPFVRLTTAILAAFPTLRHYNGQHRDIVPHLSIGIEHDSTSRGRLMAEAALSLPLTATANLLLLVRSGPDDWVTLRGFPLGA